MRKRVSRTGPGVDRTRIGLYAPLLGVLACLALVLSAAPASASVHEVVTGEYGTGDWGAYYGKLDEYYQNCVIGGRRSLSIPAHGFADFANAVRRKLILEIASND